MDLGEEADPVLRSLGEDLAREDPRLAALLTGRRPRRIRRARLLLALPLLAALFLLPVTTAVGVIAIVLVLASPLAVCLTDPRPDGGSAPGSC
jgi:hypothetical protein